MTNIESSGFKITSNKGVNLNRIARSPINEDSSSTLKTFGIVGGENEIDGSMTQLNLSSIMGETKKTIFNEK